MVDEIIKIRDSKFEHLCLRDNYKPDITILGIDALGCLFGGILSENGLDVTLIDPCKEYIDKINTNGLILYEKSGKRIINYKRVHKGS